MFNSFIIILLTFQSLINKFSNGIKKIWRKTTTKKKMTINNEITMMTTIETKPKSTSITKTALFIITFFIFVKAAESSVIPKYEIKTSDLYKMSNNDRNIDLTNNIVEQLHINIYGKQQDDGYNSTVKEELLGMEKNLTRRRFLVIKLADYISNTKVRSKKTTKVLQVLIIGGMVGNMCLLIAFFAMKTTQVVQNWR